MINTKTLTLTHEERQAIDRVGHRYSHGDDFYKFLLHFEWNPQPDDGDAWGDPGDLDIFVEIDKMHDLWTLLCRDDMAGFASDLVGKLVQFCWDEIG